MRPDVLDRLRAADPARADNGSPEPDWEAMERDIRRRAHARPGRRRLPVPVPALAAAAVVLGVVAAGGLLPGGAGPTALERAYAAASRSAIHHYVVVSQELEGPARTPVPDTRSTREGWIDPATGESRLVSPAGDEWVSDGRRTTMYDAHFDTIVAYDEPRRPDGGARRSAPDDTGVLGALTRAYRAGELRDEGVTTFEGRHVRRLVAENADRTWRQTFLVDAETHLPVLFLSEAGDHLRAGRPTPPGQRVIEERFERFERLPDDSDRSVLEATPHPGAERLEAPKPARPPRRG